MAGIKESLDAELEKTSPSLGRSAVYKSTARVSRLPRYLTIHQVRFFFRRDIQKKTKVLRCVSFFGCETDARRQVKFPFELDASEIASEDLAKRIRPVNQAIKEIDKDRRERANVRRRTRIIDEEKRRAEAQPGTAAAAAATASSSSAAMDVDGEAAADEETSLRSKEKERLRGLIDSDLAKDEGCNPTGVYQLVALLTHKGASADGGHYISWVSQEAADGTKADDPEKALWYKFDDDKVSLVTRDTITALAGGGEGSAAFLLLYKAAELA